MTGTIQFDGFKAGDSYPASGNSVFYAHGWVTGGLQTVTVDITLPKPCPSNLTITPVIDSMTVRGNSGYVGGSSTITPDGASAIWRSPYIITLAFTFNTALTNVTNNTPVALYINGRIVFS